MKRLVALLLLITLPSSLQADEIAVQEIGGVPVIRTKIHYGEKFIEAHILIDLGLAVPLVIHEKSIGGLEIHPKDTAGKRVEIEFATGNRWQDIPIVAQKVGFLETLTAKYAKELREVPVVAVVGLPAIKSNVVELDLGRGLLRTIGMASDEARAAEMDYEAKRFGILLNGTGPLNKPLKALLAMRTADSTLDLHYLKEARRAGEKPNVLEIGGISFSDHTPFRFNPLDGAAPETIGAILGVGALRDYTVTIWPKRKKIAFVPHTESPFPQAEQDYFFALADKKPEGVEAFIATEPGQRLMDEACIALWTMLLDDPASTTVLLTKALETIGAHYDSLRRSTLLAQIADQLDAGGRQDRESLSMRALNLAMDQSSGALDATAVHGVHVRLGRKAFLKNDLQQARRHLLSAAFGMPKDGGCNFWLGEVYQAMGKHRRAWSRYVQTLLDPRVDAELRVEALERLDALNRDPDFRESFNMVVAEQYMAGRLEDAEFHAPSRYKLAQQRYPGHVKLVEFFTDVSNPDTGGPQLAFQALHDYFDGEVALIQYHLNDPLHTETAADRLSYYQKKWMPLAVIDGVTVHDHNVSMEEKLADNAAENYAALRDACLLEKASPEPAWTLDAHLHQAGSKVSGSITVEGTGAPDKLRLHAMLCERSVMALEDNGVFFHHFVVRDALTPPEGLDLKSALEQPFDFAVDAKLMREQLTRKLTSDLFEGYRSKPAYVDANKLMVVLFVQHGEDRRILAADTFGLPQEDEVL